MKINFLRTSLLFAFLSCSPWVPAPAAQVPASMASQAVTYEVRNGDQKGKLMVGEMDLAFESLTDGKHSRSWKYAEIRSFEKKGRKDMRVKPYKGSTYDFQISDGKLRDQIYNAISDKVLAARTQGKK